MDWGFPENFATFGGRVDALYGIILLVTAIMFVIVEAALLVFVFRYRHREGRKATYTHGNNRLEAVWTIVPFLGVAFLAIASLGAWLDLKLPSHFPRNGLDLRVEAKQFEWNVTYPGADGRLGTPDDFVKRNQLHVPAGVPVRITLTAQDVIHSFFLPQLRVKQDAVPGMETHVWFEATRPGQLVLGCAELCGTGHYRMRGSVTVHAAEDFRTWHGQQAPRAAAAAVAR